MSADLVVIVTTRARLEAVRAELETAWTGLFTCSDCAGKVSA